MIHRSAVVVCNSCWPVGRRGENALAPLSREYIHFVSALFLKYTFSSPTIYCTCTMGILLVDSLFFLPPLTPSRCRFVFVVAADNLSSMTFGHRTCRSHTWRLKCLVAGGGVASGPQKGFPERLNICRSLFSVAIVFCCGHQRRNPSCLAQRTHILLYILLAIITRTGKITARIYYVCLLGLHSSWYAN